MESDLFESFGEGVFARHGGCGLDRGRRRFRMKLQNHLRGLMSSGLLEYLLQITASALKSGAFVLRSERAPAVFDGELPN